jgi:hypothetical protein
LIEPGHRREPLHAPEAHGERFDELRRDRARALGEDLHDSKRDHKSGRLAELIHELLSRQPGRRLFIHRRLLLRPPGV